MIIKGEANHIAKTSVIKNFGYIISWPQKFVLLFSCIIGLATKKREEMDNFNFELIFENTFKIIIKKENRKLVNI